jgi:hypothetical protein
MERTKLESELARPADALQRKSPAPAKFSLLHPNTIAKTAIERTQSGRSPQWDPLASEPSEDFVQLVFKAKQKYELLEDLRRERPAMSFGAKVFWVLYFMGIFMGLAWVVRSFG